MQLHNCINYLLTVAQHEVSKRFAEALAPYGVTPGQYGVLNCLWQNGFCTPRELAQTLCLENSTISGILDRMQKQGLISRELDPSDHRSVRVFAVGEGLAIKDDVLRTVDALNVEAQASAGFASDEWARVLEALRRIGKIDETQEKPAAQ